MKRMISCDWGTSTLRLRVVDVDTTTIEAELSSTQGISNTFELWKQSGRREEERFAFYQGVLSEQINKLEEQIKLSLKTLPVIISGMASSNIGMMELPYKEIPIAISAHDLLIKTIEPNEFQHPMVVISGVKTSDDVLRGEETQLIGCFDNEDDQKDHVYIFPGTHSKHVFVKNGRVEDFKTYMTGEFFELLSRRSILSNVVEENSNLDDERNLQSFEKGVTDSQNMNLLHSSFVVRTNLLFKKLSKQENHNYLSGLLIGTELGELRKTQKAVTVVSNHLLNTYYTTALRKLYFTDIRHIDAGKAVVNGHCKIFRLVSKTM